MRVLVTGGTGFVGSHLLESYLDDPAVELVAVRRRRSDPSNVRGLSDRVRWYTLDLMDSYAVNRMIWDVEPDVVHHLAAQSFVKASWESPVETLTVNLLGTLYLLEAVRNYPKHPIIVHVASSSEVYGKITSLPITEEAVPEPLSPYGVSKLAMDRLAVQYHRSYGVRTVVTRGFNHTGPRRGEQFAESSFAKQIALAELGKGLSVIRVGDLSAKRDYTDVRDMCRAYRLAVFTPVEFGVPYNVCAGHSVSMQEVLDCLVSYSTCKSLAVEVDKERLRPSDIPDLRGSSDRFSSVTYWSPQIPLSETLKDLLDYWRERLLVGSESTICNAQ